MLFHLLRSTDRVSLFFFGYACDEDANGNMVVWEGDQLTFGGEVASANFKLTLPSTEWVGLCLNLRRR